MPQPQPVDRRFGPVSQALAVAALLAAPSLAGDRFMDDWLHLLVLDGHPGFPGSPWWLFDFATGDPAKVLPIIERGPYPWWTFPEVRLSFLRPLTSGLAILEHRLFGGAPFPAHLHSFLWFLGLVAVVLALFRRALGPPRALPAAALAGLLFALDEAHAVPVAWVANRNALVAAVPVLLGLLAHVRWREERWRAGLPLSLLGYAVGLAGGEAALAALAYLAAYELFAAPGRARARAVALLPVALLGIAYVALYKLLRAGAFGSGVYLDPLLSPGAFLLAAPGRALALVGGLLLGAPADLWLLGPATRPALVGAGVAGLALVGWLLRSAWPTLEPRLQRGVAWLGAGALLSLLPVLATFPLNRLLLLPSVGGAAVLAIAIRHGLEARGPRRAAAQLLVLLNVILPPLAWIGSYALLHYAATAQRTSALQSGLSDEALTRRVVFFAATDPALALYPAIVRVALGREGPRAWLPISMAPHDHLLTRTGADVFELEVIGGRMLETVFEQLVRDPAVLPLPVGTRVRLDGVTVTLLALEEGLPKRLEVRFDAPPEGGDYTFPIWRSGRLEPLTLPAVGASVRLPLEPGLFGT